MLGAVSPPKPPIWYDLLTGNSRDFAASVGNWTNSGGTLTRSTARQLVNQTASLKLAVTGAGQYAETPVPGLFKAGVEYWALVFINNSDGANTRNLQVDFGLIGTDATSKVHSLWNGGLGHATDSFLVAAVRWVPTANRTGVKLRLQNNSAATFDWYCGMARVVRSPGLLTLPPMFHEDQWLIPSAAAGGYAKVSLSQYTGGHHGLAISNTGLTVSLETQDGNVGFSINTTGPYSWAEHTAGDKSTAGSNEDWGADYVGWYINELNSTHLQLWPYSGQFVQLLDGGGSAGFSHRRTGDPSTLDGKIEDSFQWDFFLAGAQTTGTNKMRHFQVPAKCIIDEVRIHLGTAPTGSTFIVDVNDDGVTVFTTQGNRPAIAISGTDATSGVADGGTAVAKDSVLTIDIDQIGSTIAGSDLTVFIRGRFRW